MAYLDYDGLQRYNAKVNGKLDQKANVDGAYENLTAGNAEQLISSVMTEDKVPYNFRTSGGSIDIGDREVDKLVGGTLAWNQLMKSLASDNGYESNYSYTSTITYNDGSLVDTAILGFDVNYPISFNANSKYLCVVDMMCSVNKSVNVRKLTSGDTITSISLVADTRKTTSFIFNLSSKGSKLQIMASAAEGDVLTIYNWQLFDLTQMFGSTIADYIYSLEQATAGAGVAWFRKLFPNDYYAYNAGQLMSVKTSSHDMVGFNAYDNSTGKAKLVGGMEYQITGTYTSISYSTGETLTPDSNGKFTPTSDGELTVSGGNATDTCVHLVWDGERDGEFEAYVKHSYALDPDLELRGIPKLDANDQLYYDGDTYESDGTVTRKYGIVDLGTLTWDVNTTYNAFRTTSVTDAKSHNQLNLIGEINGKGYIQIGKMSADAADKTIVVNSISHGVNTIFIKDTSYTDAATFKTAMSGVYLVYELATPTTEEADAFTNPQIVDDFGTETYVDNRDVQIPVGHDTKYMINLRAKLEMMPNSPDADGDYVVRHNNGANTYVPLVIPTELPAAPSEDGTYVLTCTVVDGQATLTWESTGT